MKFVGQMLINLEVLVFSHPFDIPFEVINTNIQWPLSDHSSEHTQLKRAVYPMPSVDYYIKLVDNREI